MKQIISNPKQELFELAKNIQELKEQRQKSLGVWRKHAQTVRALSQEIGCLQEELEKKILEL